MMSLVEMGHTCLELVTVPLQSRHEQLIQFIKLVNIHLQAPLSPPLTPLQQHVGSVCPTSCSDDLLQT